MKKYFLIIILLGFSFYLSFGQTVYDKISKKICRCIKKEKVLKYDDIDPCIGIALNKYWLELLDFHKVNNITEIKKEEIGKRIATKLFKNCEYAYNLYLKSTVNKDNYIASDSILNCDDLKTGEFYYISDTINNITDTTYVTISNKFYVERINNGKAYSLLSIKWNSDCEFTLTFIESNDIFKGSLSNRGDKYKYEVIRNSNKSMIVKYLWFGKYYFLEYFKR